ncbi:MAG: hypothetical protein CMN76_05250 [Spirochaetaceae bacterium]|nr:hypothetical protein [Spirochaetaceae bacterium]
MVRAANTANKKGLERKNLPKMPVRGVVMLDLDARGRILHILSWVANHGKEEPFHETAPRD